MQNPITLHSDDLSSPETSLFVVVPLIAAAACLHRRCSFPSSQGFEIDLCKIFSQITKIVFSTHALLYLIEFFKYAITYGLMFCFECWSFELLILIAGILPNPQLEASVLSVWLQSWVENP
ncbi:MATE efflux family protein [Trifolium repens]|nr:MATE efflux family protein [Trifolium repens]